MRDKSSLAVPDIEQALAEQGAERTFFCGDKHSPGE